MALPELKSFVPKKLAIPTLWQLNWYMCDILQITWLSVIIFNVNVLCMNVYFEYMNGQYYMYIYYHEKSYLKSSL